MQNKMVKAYAPASIANVGAGFDMLGVALEAPGDFVTAKRSITTEFKFSIESTIEHVPVTTTENVAAYVALQMIEAFKPDFGIEMVLHKHMPLGSGMGSSGASCVAAAMAVNALLENPVEKKELLPFVIEGERKASGSAHADNVAPSLLGGACIIRTGQPIDVIRFRVHSEITWIVLHPHIHISTADARCLLPPTLPLEKVIAQMGNVSGLILGLIEGNAKKIRACMVDQIAEPVRQSAIPGFHETKKAALMAGALGFGISGSGPSMFSATLVFENAHEIAKIMSAVFTKTTGLAADYYISRTNMQGAKIV